VEVERRLRLPPGLPPGLRVGVTRARSAHNPHSFIVSLSGPDVIGSAKVKIELWQTDAQVLADIRIVVSTISMDGAATTFVPSETLEEIVADKVYAVGARKRLKARDVFDLWWLSQHAEKPALQASAFLARLRIYPHEEPNDTATLWLQNSQKQLITLTLPATPADVARDLQRWLPSSWPMTPTQAGEMLAVTARQLGAGIQLMQAFAAK